MVIIGKSIAALTFICDTFTLQAEINSLFIYNNQNIEGEFIYNGIKIQEVKELFGMRFILGAVMPETKRKIVSAFNLQYTSLQHRSSIISPSAKIDLGLLIGEGASVSGNVLIGKYVTVYCHTSVNHDCEIGDYVTLCPNVAVCGSVKIGEGTFIGAGSVIKNGVTIGKNCTIGCGSVVVKDVEDEKTVYGNPAKIHV